MVMREKTKINLDEVVKEINRKYNIDLKKILQDYEIGHKSVYIYLYILAESILQANPDIHKSYIYENKQYKNTNINLLAACLDIEVVEIRLKLSSDIFMDNDLNGYIDTYQYATIYINELDGGLTKCYTLATLLAYYIISSIKETESIWYFRDAYFFKCPEQELYNILATFLLMPIDTTLNFVTEYIAENAENKRCDKHDMSHYLSCKLGISNYHTVICFYHIKCLGEILYNYDGELEIGDICEKVRSYEKLFK